MAWSATGLFAIKAANITTCLLLSPAPLLITFYRPSWNCLLYLTVLHSICYYIGPASSAVKSESTASDPVGFLSLFYFICKCVCVWPLLAAVQPRIRLLSDARTESRWATVLTDCEVATAAVRTYMKWRTRSWMKRTHGQIVAVPLV